LETEVLLTLVVVFAVVSFVYGSVGLGGGSSYVATMALLGMDHTTMPLVALGLNIIVAGGGFLRYLGCGSFRWRVFAPLVLTSAPSAFLAAQLPVSRTLFQGVLGIFLLFAAARMLAPSRWSSERSCGEQDRPVLMALLGLVLGTVAGVTGIGGGIYLAPLLLILGLATPKETAALCAGLVVLNSASGILGHVISGATMPWQLFLPLAVTVFVGGQAGAYRGAHRFQPLTVQTVFGCLVFLVSIRLLTTAFG